MAIFVIYMYNIAIMASDFDSLRCFYAWQRRVAGAQVLCVSLSGVFRVGETSRIVYDHWILDYCYFGEVEVRVGGEDEDWFERGVGRGHLYAPGTSYWERPIEDGGGMRSGYIAFGKGEDVGLDGILDSRLGFASIDDRSGELGGLIERMARLGQERAEGAFCRAQGLLYEAFDLLLNSREVCAGRRELVGDRGGVISLSNRAIEFMNQHLCEMLSLDDVADYLDVSVSTLCHKFKLEAGETLMGRYMKMKVEFAKHLMRSGRRFGDIAEQLGFCDVFHFSKTFKRVVGCSPRAYRKRLLGGEIGG